MSSTASSLLIGCGAEKGCSTCFATLLLIPHRLTFSTGTLLLHGANVFVLRFPIAMKPSQRIYSSRVPARGQKIIGSSAPAMAMVCRCNFENRFSNGLSPARAKDDEEECSEEHNFER